MGVESTHPNMPHGIPSGQLRQESHGHVTVTLSGGWVCQGLPTHVFARKTFLPPTSNFKIYVFVLCNSIALYYNIATFSHVLLLIGYMWFFLTRLHISPKI